MIVLGVILVVIGVLLSIPILYWIGAILAVVGVVLTIAGALGHGVGGRSTFW